MNIAICDDTFKDRKTIKKMLEDYAGKNNLLLNIQEFNNEKDLLKRVEDFDILILDVILENSDGLEIAKRIRSLNKDILIFFYSSSLEYAPYAFSSYGYTYLLKPVNKFVLFNELDRALNQLERDILIVYDELNIRHTIHTNNIFYINASLRKSQINFRYEHIVVNKPLKEWILSLNDNIFSLANRSELVNLKNIKKIANGQVVLKNDDVLYLSRNYKKSFETMFYEYMECLL